MGLMCLTRLWCPSTTNNVKNCVFAHTSARLSALQQVLWGVKLDRVFTVIPDTDQALG